MSDAETRVRNFQLYLLRAMGDAPKELVEQALDALDADEAAMEEAFCGISELAEILVPGTNRLLPAFTNLTEYLGSPVGQNVQQTERGEIWTWYYVLPLWPKFLFELAGTPEGYFDSGRFTENPAAPAVEVGDPGDLAPWSVTKRGVESRFGPLEELELWPPYEAYTLRRAGTGGVTRTYNLGFAWELLQDVQYPE